MQFHRFSSMAALMWRSRDMSRIAQVDILINHRLRMIALPPKGSNGIIRLTYGVMDRIISIMRVPDNLQLTRYCLTAGIRSSGMSLTHVAITALAVIKSM